MKHLLSILLFSSIFATELTVEGDLNVTGNIQNQTIDSLVQVIQSLESQLIAMQGGNKLETRIFTLNNLSLEYNHGSCNETQHQEGGCNSFELNFSEITGYEIQNAFIRIFKIENINNSNGGAGILYLHDREYPSHYQKQVVECHNDNNPIFGWPDYQTGHLRGSESITYYSENGPPIKLTYVGSDVTLDLTLAITAQFPSDSDAQLRKTGLQSKNETK